MNLTLFMKPATKKQTIFQSSLLICIAGYTFGPPILKGDDVDRCGPLFKADCPSDGKSCCNVEEGRCSRSTCDCSNCVDFRKDGDTVAGKKFY